MGKIKTKLIKRTAKTLIKKGIPFTEEFKTNKKTLGNTMPSKKVRNQIAGYLAREKRREKENKLKIEESLKAVKK